MRSAMIVVALGLVAACVDRTVDVEADYTEEVELICKDLCDKVVTCRDPPAFETEEECRTYCTLPEQLMYEDSTCGLAFRAYFGCLGGTATCEEYLDASNVYTEDYMCKAEGEVLATLLCGALEAND